MNISRYTLMQALGASAVNEHTADIDVQEKKLLTPSAVLVPLVERVIRNNASYHVLLTKRANHLKHHAGQISFPGGRAELSDPTLEHTALRETFEETGITPKRVEVIGRLPNHQTISRYLITPFVGIIGDDYQLTLDQQEVSEAFEVPLSFVCNPANHTLQSAFFQGQKRYYYSIKYDNYNIWGATARILVEFSKHLYPLSQTLPTDSTSPP